MARTKKNSKRQRRKRKLILFIIEIIILMMFAGGLFVYSKLDLIRNWIIQRLEKMRFPKKLRKHLKDILLLHVLVWTTVNRVFTSPVTVM